MSNERIEEFLKEIELFTNKKKAYLSYSSNEDFGYAQGNKDGLLLYAAELLKAAKEIDIRKFDEGDREMFNPNFDWIEDQNDTPFAYIQITNKERSEINTLEELEIDSWKDKVFRFGCVAILIFAMFLAVVGWF